MEEFMKTKEEILERMNDLKEFFCYSTTCIKNSPKQHMCRFCLTALNKRKIKLVGCLQRELKGLFTCSSCFREFIKTYPRGRHCDRYWDIDGCDCDVHK
jgi:hypothetical protein